jgi:hypothetical protein
MVMEAAGNEVRRDQTAMVALNEEIPMTACSMGITIDVPMHEQRKKYPSIVYTKNNIEQGLLQCDCCRS